MERDRCERGDLTRDGVFDQVFFHRGPVHLRQGLMGALIERGCSVSVLKPGLHFLDICQGQGKVKVCGRARWGLSLGAFAAVRRSRRRDDALVASVLIRGCTGFGKVPSHNAQTP